MIRVDDQPQKNSLDISINGTRAASSIADGTMCLLDYDPPCVTKSRVTFGKTSYRVIHRLALIRDSSHATLINYMRVFSRRRRPVRSRARGYDRIYVNRIRIFFKDATASRECFPRTVNKISIFHAKQNYIYFNKLLNK